MDPRRRRRPGPPEGEPIVFAADKHATFPFELSVYSALADGLLRAEGVRGASELALGPRTLLIGTPARSSCPCRHR